MSFSEVMKAFLRMCLAVALLAAAPDLRAHSGKARFHVVVDTDGAADDLRALCMLLGNREVEVLAVIASEGALMPPEAAARAAALLAAFHHEGIPVGVGRSVGAPEPAWRAYSRAVDWGAPVENPPSRSAADLLAEALAAEDEKVWIVALSALTNLDDLLQAHPDRAERIERVVWYNTLPDLTAGVNYCVDPLAARRVLASGVPVTVVSEHPDCAVGIASEWLDSVAAVPTLYAQWIVRTHCMPPLAPLVETHHLRAWDDLAVAYLFAPELFEACTIAPTVTGCMPADARSAAQVCDRLVAVLRGKPDSESRVFYGFPQACGLYAADVVPILDEAIARHGVSEWRAGVLTNELHGHLGIYATVGVKMGIRAREYFDIGVDDIQVLSFAGSCPPISCMNDGLQCATGATLGHGLIAVAEDERPRPEARFRFKGRTIRLVLKPEYARRIREDVQRGIALHGNWTEPYWQYVRALALQYWRDFDRHEMFDIFVCE